MVLTWLVFRPVLGHGFVDWDDTTLLVNTSAYRNLWWPAIRHAFSSTLTGHYAPLTWVSFSVDTWLWGPTAAGFHRTNLVLHVANAGLFYALGRALIQRASTLAGPALGWGAAGAALFFAIHPMRAETVAWLTERRGVLSGFFVLLSVLAYLRASRGGTGRRWALTAPGGGVPAGPAGEAERADPAGGADRARRLPAPPAAPPGRGWLAPAAWPIWREKLPHLGLAGVWGVLVYASVVAGADVRRLDPETWVGLVLQSLWLQVQKTILPVRLSPLYEFAVQIEFRDPVTLVSGVGVLAVTLGRLRTPVAVARGPRRLDLAGDRPGPLHGSGACGPADHR